MSTIDYTQLKAELIEELALSELAPEKQDELLGKMLEALLKRIFMNTMERLGDEAFAAETLVSLDDYVKRAPEGQKQIYFATGPDLATLLKNPNLEVFRRKNLEVLYLADPIDEIALQQLSVDGYGALVSMILDAARELCQGRVLFALEGGYHLTALPWCVRRTIELLRGDAPAPDPLGAAAASSAAGFDQMLARIKALHAL